MEADTVNSIMKIGQEKERRNTKEVSGQRRKRRILRVSLSAWQVRIWICQLLLLWIFTLRIRKEN